MCSFPSCAGLVRTVATCRWPPLLRATPCRALIDEPIALKVFHLPQSFPVTMRARMTCEDGHLWQSVSYYHSDEDGVVDCECPSPPQKKKCKFFLFCNKSLIFIYNSDKAPLCRWFICWLWTHGSVLESSACVWKKKSEVGWKILIWG